MAFPGYDRLTFVMACMYTCVYVVYILMSLPRCAIYLGVNCIQNFHLERYIVGNMVGNLVLQRRASGALKHVPKVYPTIYLPK